MAMAATRSRGWWYPWIFVGGMLVVIVVNGIMIYVATSTFTGLATENPYEKGLAYNKTLAETRAQEAMGWKTEFAFAPSGGGKLTVTYRDGEGKPIDGLGVEARVTRPTSSGQDRTRHLAPVGPGTYAAALDLPLPGIWDVRLTAARNDQIHREGHRIQIP